MEVHQEEEEGPAAHGDASQRQQLTQLTYVQLCLQLASQLADGLAHAHQRGIVHRDLKPENVLACRDGRAMILDFNLSEEIVSHVLEDLRRQLSDRPLRHAANPSRRERCEKWCRRHPRVASGTGVLAACAVVILVLGTSLVIRGRKVDELAARQKLAAFAAAVPRVQASLTTPDVEPSILRDAVSIAERELRKYLPRTDKGWRRQRAVRLLDTAGQTQLAEDLAELAYLTANAYLRLGRETIVSRQAWRWHLILMCPSFSVDSAACNKAAWRLPWETSTAFWY